MLLYPVCSQKLQKCNNAGGNKNLYIFKALMAVFSVFETNISYKFTARRKKKIAFAHSDFIFILHIRTQNTKVTEIKLWREHKFNQIHNGITSPLEARVSFRMRQKRPEARVQMFSAHDHWVITVWKMTRAISMWYNSITCDFPSFHPAQGQNSPEFFEVTLIP